MLNRLIQLLLNETEGPMEMLIEGFKALEIASYVCETIELLKRYSVQSVSKSNGNTRSRQHLVRAYINRAKLFCNVINKELYDYSDAEIEFPYKNPLFNQPDKKILTKFLNRGNLFN